MQGERRLHWRFISQALAGLTQRRFDTLGVARRRVTRDRAPTGRRENLNTLELGKKPRAPPHGSALSPPDGLSGTQKVTPLMGGMIIGDRDEKQKEHIQFATNEIFCHSIAVSKNAAIKQDGTLYGKPFPGSRTLASAA